MSVACFGQDILGIQEQFPFQLCLHIQNSQSLGVGVGTSDPPFCLFLPLLKFSQPTPEVQQTKRDMKLGGDKHGKILERDLKIAVHTQTLKDLIEQKQRYQEEWTKVHPQQC